MYQVAETMPTAEIAINKGRLKKYNKGSNIPTYYLQKGQEFQIELYNPTRNNILAKIELNGNSIGQGGLVLRPGERVFLDRYIDVAKKFKFDTYEVANTSSARKAIEENGDFKVDFYKERIPEPTQPIWRNPYFYDRLYYYNINQPICGSGQPYNHGDIPFINLSNTNGLDQLNTMNVNSTFETTQLNGTLGLASLSDSMPIAGSAAKFSAEVRSEPIKKNPFRSLQAKKSKTIETGRVEKGSTSNQKLETVQMNWEYLPFYTVEYKLLPVSQKVNTVDDIQVKRYCTNCGAKVKSNFKFCPNCGARV